MISPSDIVSHLRSYLPAFTDKFSVTLSGTATSDGSTVTVSATAHGLTVGKKVVISSGKFSNGIASVVDNGDGSVRFTTNFDHDLTAPQQVNDPTTLELDGFNESVWNTTHTIFAVPNRRTFEIEFPTGVDTLPTGSGVLLEGRSGLIGLHTVATVPDANTFTIDVIGYPSFPTGDIESVELVKAVRVTGCATIEHAQAMYTEQSGPNSLWAFVIPTDVDVSKDRHTMNDTIASFYRGNLGKQILIQNFAVVVFFPTSTDESGFDAKTLGYTEVYRALYSALLGFGFNDPDTQQEFVCVSNGFGAGVRNNAYSSIVYDFSVPSIVTIEGNGWPLQVDVAFRNVISNWHIDGDTSAELDTNINLDEEPL